MVLHVSTERFSPLAPQLTFSIQTIPLDNGVEREAGFQPIRITPYLVNDRIDASLPTEVFGPGGPLEQGLNLLSQALSVWRLQGNLVFKPTVSCGNETEICIAAGAGSCTCDSATAILPSLVCAEVPFPNGHIGTAETQICDVANQQCVTVGPNGAGLADTDFVLYVTALQTGKDKRYTVHGLVHIPNICYPFDSIPCTPAVRSMQ